MGDNSEIQWTDATWNPVTGCSKVSPGCAHCYAETLTMRYAKGWKVPGLPWTPRNALENVILKPERLDQPLRWKKPRMIFVNSMSDLFHERLTGMPPELGAHRRQPPPDDDGRFAALEGEPRRPGYIAEVFAVMSIATRHTFQVLTKRPAAMAYVLGQSSFWLEVNAARLKYNVAVLEGGMDEYARGERTLPNVWLGTSIENRGFNWRADALSMAPAAVRFVSAEPLLGPLVPGVGVPLGEWTWPDGKIVDEDENPPLDFERIDWLIVGGESGPRNRPMEPKWVTDLRDWSHAVDPGGVRLYPTAFFFKQWGGRTPKAGGRLLDGREWNEMPAKASVSLEEVA